MKAYKTSEVVKRQVVKMGVKLGKKTGIKPKRDVQRNEKVKSVQKKAPKEEELTIIDVSEDESASESEDAVNEEEEQEQENEQEDSEEEGSEEEEFGGFSSTDEEDSEEEEENEDEAGPKKKSKESHEVKQLPKQSALSTKQSKKLKKGLIYIGRLPEDFEESELKKYFNQFGDITNVNVPRSKKSGRSKHFAFVEFDNVDDAKVAQETMNNYLLLNHQLKVNLVDEEFKASKKFKKNYFRVSKPKEDLETLNANANKKKEQRRKALKDAGFDF